MVRYLKDAIAREDGRTNYPQYLLEVHPNFHHKSSMKLGYLFNNTKMSLMRPHQNHYLHLIFESYFIFTVLDRIFDQKNIF